MKKIFAVLTIATVFVACGGSEQPAPATPEVTPAPMAVDTTKKDSAAVATPAPAEAPKAEAKKH